MPANMEFGIRLTADSKELVDAVSTAKDEVEKLSAVFRSGRESGYRFSESTDAITKSVDNSRASVAAYNASSVSVAASLRSQAEASNAVSVAAQRIMDRYDPLGTKLRSLQSDFATLRKEMGNSATDGAIKSFQGLEDEITKTKGLMESAGISGADGFNKAAAAADKSAFATAGARRELLVLGHEALTGNFSRMPGSFMVLAERMSITEAMLNPITIGFVAVGAAVIGVAVAIEKGREEMIAMNNALAVTSNYAGLTRGGIESLSQSMTASGRVTIGTAKDIVTALVASGRISSESIGVVAKLTDDFARSTGSDIEKIAPEMIKLFSDPLKGAEELNKSMHFLTAADIEHIATLERLGGVQEAQLFLAEKLTSHMPKENENVGILIKSYRGWAYEITQVVDGLKGLGAETTTESKMKRIQGEISNLQEIGGKGAAIEMRKKELMALMDVYVAEQKLNLAQTEAAKAIDYENSISTEANKSRLHQIKELEDAQTKLNTYIVNQTLDGKTVDLSVQSRVNELAKQEAEIRRGMGAESRHYIQAEIEQRKALEEISIKAGIESIDTQLKLGNISQKDHDSTKLALELEKNTVDQIANIRLQSVQNLNVSEKQNLSIALDRLKAEAVALNIKGGFDSQVNEKKDYDAIAKNVEKLSATEISAIDKAIAAQKLHNDEIGKTAEQIALVRAASEDAGTAKLVIDAQVFRDASKYSDIYKEMADNLDILIAKRREYSGLQVIASEREKVKAASDYENATQKKLWTDVDQFAHTAFNNIFEKGKNTFQEIGKVIKSSILDVLYQMTIKQWIFSISGVAVGAGASGMAGAAVNSAASSAGGLGSWLSTGSSVYNAASKGFSSLIAAPGDLGQAAGYYGSTALGASGSTATAIGTAGSYVGAGMAGIALGSVIAGDKKVIGLDGTTISAIGTAVGAIWGAPGMVIGGLIGGAFDAAFGMGAKKSGTTTLAGTISAGGIAGSYQTPWTQDGGWFRSDKSGTQSDPVSAAQQTALQNTVTGTQSVFNNLIAASGEAVKSIGGWTFAINQQVNTQAQETQLVTDIATSMGNFLIPSLAQFSIAGETLADTAVRVHDELVMTNSIAVLMGNDIAGAFGSIGIASIGMRDSLIQIMGGVSSANGMMQSYYSNFLTSTQQNAIQVNALSTQFAALGVAMPATRDEFSALVSAQDLTTSSGQKMFAGLMSLNGAFAAAIAPASALRGLQIQLMQAQGDAAGALAAQRADVIANLPADQAIVQQQIYAAQDLETAATAAATAQQNLASSLTASLTLLVSQGQSIKNFTASLGTYGTGLTVAGAKDKYLSDLASAKSGDATAYSNLPNSADAYIKASIATKISTTDQAMLVAGVSNALNSLKPVVMLDQNTKLLDDIAKATAAGALSLGNLDLNGIKALFDVSGALDIVTKSDIPDYLKTLITDQTKVYTANLTAALSASTDPDLTALLVDGEKGYMAIINATTQKADITPEARKLAIDAGGAYSALVGAVLAKDMEKTEAGRVALGIGADLESKVSGILADKTGFASSPAGILAIGKIAYLESQVSAAYTGGDANAKKLAFDGATTFITDISAKLAEDALTKSLAPILSGTTDGKVTVSGSLAFDPNSPMQSVFNAIQASSANSTIYLKAIADNQLSEMNGIVSAIGSASVAATTAAKSAASGATTTITASTSTASAMASANTRGAQLAAAWHNAGTPGEVSNAWDALVAARKSFTDTYGGIPSFSVGTNYVPYDMKANIHEGERIFPKADNTELMARLRSPQNNSESIVAELIKVREELKRVYAELAKSSVNTKKTADTLIRVTRDGNSMLTAAA
jgi:phage-related minor tail protein